MILRLRGLRIDENVEIGLREKKERFFGRTFGTWGPGGVHNMPLQIWKEAKYFLWKVIWFISAASQIFRPSYGPVAGLNSKDSLHACCLSSIPRYVFSSLYFSSILTSSLDCFFFMTANLFKGQTLYKFWNVIVIRPVCLYFYKYQFLTVSSEAT